MRKVLYVSCPSGISGDMFLSGLIDCGVSFKEINRKLTSVLLKAKIGNWKLEIENVKRNGINAKHIKVISDYRFHTFDDMIKVIKHGNFPEKVERLCVDIMRLLKRHEIKVHGSKKIKLHEMSHLDTFIDIVGSVYGVHILDPQRILCSRINLGDAAPLTLSIVQEKKIPVYSSSNYELTTPTGIGIISVLTDSFGDMPLMKIKKVGFGAGSMNFHENRANVLKMMVGEGEISNRVYETDEVILLQTNIDDMNPQVYPYVMDRLLKIGVLDVWLENLYMKKGRPGISLNILITPELELEVLNMIFTETSTIGIRRQVVSRYKLKRDYLKGYKVISTPAGIMDKRIEYEHAITLSKKTKKPLRFFLKN